TEICLFPVELFKRLQKLDARLHVKEREPGQKCLPRRSDESLKVAEVDDMDAAAGRERARRRSKRLFPIGDHREAIGEDDVRERRHLAEQAWTQRLCI